MQEYARDHLEAIGRNLMTFGRLSGVRYDRVLAIYLMNAQLQHVESYSFCIRDSHAKFSG